MATYYSQATGNFSTLANWNTVRGGGGAAPGSFLTTDTYTIQPTHVVSLDANISIKNLVIESHATTPGELNLSTTAGSYTLTFNAGAGSTCLAGTNLAALGKIRMGTSGTPVPSTIKGVLDVSTGVIQGNYLDWAVYCDRPTNRWATVNGDQAKNVTGVTTVTLTVDQDVTADAQWVSGAIVELCNINSGQQSWRLTFASATATTITLNVPAAVTVNATLKDGAYLVLISRPVEVRGTGTVIMSSSGTTSSPFRYDGAIIYGSDTNQSTASLFYLPYGCDFRGTASRITNLYYGKGGYWDVALVSAGPRESDGALFKGLVIGGSSAIQTSPGAYLHQDLIVSGNTNGINFMSGFVDCVVQYNTTGIVFPCELTIGKNARISNNTQDVNIGKGSMNGYGARLGSGTQVLSYLQPTFATYVGAMKSYVMMYDYADGSFNPQYGYIYGWTPCGTIVTEAAPASPPVTLAVAHKMLWERTLTTHFVEIPVVIEAGVVFSASIYLKCGTNMNLTWNFLEARLFSKESGFGETAERLSNAAINSMGSGIDTTSTAWQTLNLVYYPTPTATFPSGAKKNAVLRLWGAITSGTVTANTYLHWNYTQNAVVNANVQYIEGDDDVAGWLAAATRGVMVVP